MANGLLIMLSFLILNFALGGAFPVKINGVKEPYNGIPASTVELIKIMKAKC
ncbi:MAG: hypothetical protein WDO19_20925 [Bacteroidota bacterium]